MKDLLLTQIREQMLKSESLGTRQETYAAIRYSNVQRNNPWIFKTLKAVNTELIASSSALEEGFQKPAVSSARAIHTN